MKTKIEISGYEIEIELHEDSISIKAEKDGEVVEEMDLPLSDETEDDDNDVKPFKNFEEEDEMEESEEEDEMEESEEEDFEDLPMDDEMEDDGKLESFQSYLNRTKKANLKK